MINKLRIICLLSLLFSSCNSDYFALGKKDTAVAIKSEFKNDYSALIRNASVKQISRGDGVRAWYKIECDESVFNDIIRNNFSRSDSKNFNEFSLGENAPDFWDARLNSDTSAYINYDWNSKFSRSVAVVYYNRSTKILYFCHDAVL
jgi:hypothetical protein